jgi:hypothetical protein
VKHQQLKPPVKAVAVQKKQQESNQNAAAMESSRGTAIAKQQ